MKSNIITKYRELGHKEFMRKWREGIQRIPPINIQKIKVQGMFGSVIGTIGACIVFVIMGWYPILLFLVFNIVVQGAGYIEEYQKLGVMKKFKDWEKLDDVLMEEQK
ncbi:hypothetical protein LCGC14_3100190 [marine sediment metagenome]|uniref:Uncharacterized protein n=1 Tax=marine sediment metagenome TaxID=412755 RepID=A0A0F8YFJ4_9ZZZZ